MINLVVAYDDNDVQLGIYFEECFNNTNDAVSQLSFIALSSIRGLDCTFQNINDTVQPLNGQNFIFASYSHGNDAGECLLTDNDIFINIDNAAHFCNSFFYTTACCVGLQLGQDLINNNCFCFIGYNDSSWASYEDFYPIYIACETFALLEFLRTNKTIQQAFDEMRERFDDQIQLLVNANDILVAMELERNRDCMILLGNGSLTSADFHV